jgi:hypothetical protein
MVWQSSVSTDTNAKCQCVRRQRAREARAAAKTHVSVLTKVLNTPRTLRKESLASLGHQQQQQQSAAQQSLSFIIDNVTTSSRCQ